MKYINFFFLLLFPFVAYSQQEQDSVRMLEDEIDRQIEVADQFLVDKSWFASPIVYVQEETSLALGASGGYYFPSNDLKKVGSFSATGVYTLNNQVKLSAKTRIFLWSQRASFDADLNLRYYPDLYYGISNEITDLVIPYTSKLISFKFEPYYEILRNVQVGMHFDARFENTLKGEEFDEKEDEIFLNYGDAGWDPYFMWGLGAQIVYDTRDSRYYPQKFSNFAKLSLISYTKMLGSSYDMTSIKFDFRQYIPTWLGQIFAWQVYVDMALGDQVPFQMLPTLGGLNNLRGFREGKFKDNGMFELQTEYRIPIWWRFKLAVMCSVGDVVDVYHPEINKIKLAYGLGVRFRLNEARVNIRFDYLVNNYGENKFYISATEAF